MKRKATPEKPPQKPTEQAAQGAAQTHPGLAANVLALLEVARTNPYWQFEDEELIAMMSLPPTTVAMMKRSDQSPFVGSKSRPERVAKFLDEHPGWKPSEER